MNQLTRAASARIEDIHALRTNVDFKQKKIRNYNPEIFEEIRQRETQRINIENSSLGKL